MRRAKGEPIMHHIIAMSEESIIGTMMMDEQKAIYAVETLKPTDFTLPKLRQLFDVCKTLYEEGSPINPVSVSNKWPTKKESVADIILDSTITLMDFYAAPAHFLTCVSTIKERAHRRDIIQKTQQSARLAQSSSLSPGEIMTKIEEEIGSLEDRLSEVRPQPVKVKEVQATVVLSRGLHTGLIELDQRIGGLKNNDLILLAGRPSMGKTALAVQIADYVAGVLNCPVLFFSLEMGKEQVKQRMI